MLSKTEICIKLSEDYADRATKGGANYDDAYEHYLTRCLNRDEEELQSQYKVQGLKVDTSDGFIISADLL
jgi:hypothetical protein